MVYLKNTANKRAEEIAVVAYEHHGTGEFGKWQGVKSAVDH